MQERDKNRPTLDEATLKKLAERAHPSKGGLFSRLHPGLVSEPTSDEAEDLPPPADFTETSATSDLRPGETYQDYINRKKGG